VDDFETLSHRCLQAHVDYFVEFHASFLVAEIRQEALVQLQQNRLIVGLRKVRELCVHHQHHNVEDQCAIVAQVQESVDQLLLELLEALRVLGADSRQHLLVEPDWRDPPVALGLGVAAEDKSKINMEHAPIVLKHQVFKMSVADSQEVGCDRVPRIRQQVVVENFLALSRLF